jgi:hypothetical protein
MNKFIFQFALALTLATLTWAQDGSDIADQAAEIRKRIASGPPQFSLIGKLERGDDSEYSVNKEDFIIDSETRINGDLKIGRSAMIRGNRIGNRNYAKKIIIENSETPVLNSPSPDNIQDEVPLVGSGPAPLPGQKPVKE